MFLKTRMEQMELTMKNIERQIKQIKCDHKFSVFYDSNYTANGLWAERCSDCGKEINQFMTESNFLRAKNKYMEKMIILNNKTIIELEKA